MSFVQPGVDTPSKSPNFLLYSQILFLLVLYSVKMHHLTSLSFHFGNSSTWNNCKSNIMNHMCFNLKFVNYAFIISLSGFVIFLHKAAVCQALSLLSLQSTTNESPPEEQPKKVCTCWKKFIKSSISIISQWFIWIW